MFFILGAYLRLYSAKGMLDRHIQPQIKDTQKYYNLSEWEKIYTKDGILNLLNIPLPNFLHNYKNPCWKDQRSGRKLRCLPYFFLAGMPKSGTTDLWACLLKHPDIAYVKSKEPHWWTRLRYRRRGSTDFYVRRLDPAVKTIKSTVIEETNYHPVIAGDGSASTFWDNSNWRNIGGNTNDSTEPQIITSTLIRHVIPMARIIVILRNPTDRLFSDYLYFRRKGTKQKGPEDFHNECKQAISVMNNCLSNYTERHCVYEKISVRTNTAPVRIYIGMYSVYVKDWLRIFPREQLHFLRLEDYSINRTESLSKVFDFLDIGGMENQQELYELPVKNRRRTIDRKLGGMLNKTREMLDDFYRSYNIELSYLLKDRLFRFDR